MTKQSQNLAQLEQEQLDKQCTVELNHDDLDRIAAAAPINYGDFSGAEGSYTPTSARRKSRQ